MYISAEGSIYYNEEDLQAKSKLSPPNVITDEYVKAALEAYPEVHLGWKYAFTRATELMDERRAAKAAREGQEPPSAPQPAEVPAEVLRVVRQKDRRTNRKLPRSD